MPPTAAEPLLPVEPIRFFLAGPTYVPEDVRQAMTQPVVAHRSPSFKALWARLAERLPAVFRTRGDVYVATGSSTLLMESAVVSTVGRDVLNLTNGAFSERWHAICRSLGRAADRLEHPWGEAVDPDLLRQALRRKRYEAVTVVHNETSTGVLNPLAEIARVVREESDALLLVDAVSSLGGAPVETDAWGLDVVLTGSQKALAVPPGLALFTLSERAGRQADGVPHRGFYTDLLRYRDKHREGGPITTPAVPVAYALDHQLGRVAAEGMEARWERHRRLQQTTAAWAAERGLRNSAPPAVRSPTVSCLAPPAGAPPAPEIVRRLAGRGFTVAGGYGQWKATTFRIGHLGEVRDSDLAPLLAACDEVLEEACTAS
ncbi:MAG TPA: alanine--glyoxylate aminotransferase family protein [Thermoanaerobaculia bacterium]|nr:alanine--glyoxylate aminotransferase family protein [Thermoanaerobaculia bacterium]